MFTRRTFGAGFALLTSIALAAPSYAGEMYWIFIEMPDGTKHELTVSDHETIRDTKFQLRMEKKIPEAQQTLLRDGVALGDDKELVELDIGVGTTLTLEVTED